MTHSEGPWVGDLHEVQDARGRPVAFLAGEASTQRLANSRLIAAAPDLLAALTVSRGQWIHSVNATQCLAAIALAEGRTPDYHDRDKQ